MPFGLIATTSSLWMNLASASVRLLVPVNSVSAFSSKELATSGFGQSWFCCMYEAKSPLAETFTILPGTFSGLKPAGGLAVKASICAASADAVLASALAARPAEATRKTSRRETFVDRVERFCIRCLRRNSDTGKYHARASPANPRGPILALAIRQPGDGQAGGPRDAQLSMACGSARPSQSHPPVTR